MAGQGAGGDDVHVEGSDDFVVEKGDEQDDDGHWRNSSDYCGVFGSAFDAQKGAGTHQIEAVNKALYCAYKSHSISK